MMRRIGVVVAVVGILVLPLSAQANTVTLSDWTTGNFATNAAGGGGPFKANTTGALLGVSEFITFCIEFNEHFTPGGTYNFALSNGAISGGVSGGNPDPVSDATKWLYYQAISGGYSSWYFGVTGSVTGPAVGATFQHAIWFLEGEKTLAEIGNGSDAHELASHAGLQNWAALYAQGHRVDAMNLTSATGAPVQDQLAYRNVPEPGSLMLLGTGLVGLASLIRRRRA